MCCELLLHDHAQLGTTDENGWQEIHQVGRELGAGSSSVWVGPCFCPDSTPFPRPAALGMCSTWNTCCSMEQTWVPRMRRGTRPCTSVPSTTRCGCVLHCMPHVVEVDCMFLAAFVPAHSDNIPACVLFHMCILCLVVIVILGCFCGFMCSAHLFPAPT